MEFVPSGKFVDLPSWIGMNREMRDDNAKITNMGGKVDIDTGEIHLTYQEDGRPFSSGNLRVEIKKGTEIVSWSPGAPTTQNLGGTINTLDWVTEPVPLGDGLLSRDGWYLLDDSRSPLFVDDWIQARPKNNNIDWYFFGYGLDYKAAFRSFFALSGSVPLPRKYTLGSWYSRYWPYSAADFKEIVQEYAQHDFPLDMIVMDMDWHLNNAQLKPKIDTWTGYTWDHNLIPDPEELLKWFHDQGLHVTLNDHPRYGIQPHEEMYADFMRAMGKDPASGEIIPLDAGDKHYLDTAYQYAYVPREKEGVDFWWLDFLPTPTRSLPDVDSLRVLNYYNYARSQANGMRGQSFSRWAGWGDHRYPIEFSGDADSGWGMLRFEVPFTSTAANVGAFFYSHDMGGFRGGKNDEAYTRWCQFGAFSAALRSHSTRDADMDKRPWKYPSWAEASMHDSFHLRSEMMPYLYTSMWEGTKDSIPFLRPLYIDYPEVEASYHNAQEYQFGNDLLVAPVAQPGVGTNRVATQVVWFPEGEWYDFFTGESFAGPTEGITANSINTFPLYVRGGVPLPMQAYTPHPGTSPLTDLILRCYPGEDGKTGTSAVYEDDGVTDGYKHGESAITSLSYSRRGDEITVTIAPTQGSFKNQPSTRRCVLELPCTEKLSFCSMSNAATSYDEKSQTNRIELSETSVNQGLTVVIHAAKIDPAVMAQGAVVTHMQELLGGSDSKLSPDDNSMTPEMHAAINAVQGYGLVEQNLHPYFLGSERAILYCHNHQKTPETLSITIGTAASTQVTLSNGDSVVKAPIGTGLLDSIPITVTAPDDSPGGRVLRSQVPAYHDLSGDLALKATVEASSGNGSGVIDGKVGGYPKDSNQEWTSKGEKEKAWIKLSWSDPVQAQSIWLYDRPNTDDQVLGGILQFDDGTSMDVGPLPNDASLPFKVTFPSKTIHWVKFIVNKVSPTTRNCGLAEIAVLGGS
jgi:alpha-glucosidase (family GH31 glycosyl hydrolase)